MQNRIIQSENCMIGYTSKRFWSSKVISANPPQKIVMVSWLRLPIIVINAAFILSALSIYAILPRNSPVLFGIIAEIVIPDRIALIALVVDTFSILLTKYCHFFVSRNQLIGINNKESKRPKLVNCE